ncbi:conserved unknown protein [Ectocarpus siliculosus]|uniref:Uncharacterized protein n=1 Tax=Ectocarpus siliculosus TaxID=2880 RepID=D8LGT3_ECTSI|nr:conserved unknown protein [Ectocarpus siliculosus]|eukprot:CBN79103.1 conserved unknown protein [Ectocarpus siliculosus]
MKSAFLAAVLALLSVASTDAFVAGSAKLPVRAAASRTAAVEMSAEPQSRQAFLQQGVAGVLSLAGIAALSQPASAGGLSPVSNSDKWAGVLDPRSAVKDSDKMASDGVKKDLAALKNYQSATKDISDTLAKDPQANVLPKVQQTFKFAEFRQVLNGVNDVFDEDTQRGTDLIIRNMLQDALELSQASKMKPDVPRSPRKVEILNKKLMKLDQAFEKLNAYL